MLDTLDILSLSGYPMTGFVCVLQHAGWILNVWRREA